MKNLKKFLALILSLAMILGLASSASAAIVIDDEGEEEKCTITYYDGSEELTELGSEVNHGTQITIDNTYTKDGYMLNSWNTALDGSGDTYTLGQVLTIDDDLTLYAMMTEADFAAIALIDGTSFGFDTLAEAFAAAAEAEDNVEITLCKDITLEETLVIPSADGYEYNLDLNGYVITSTITGANAITVPSGVTLTIGDNSSEGTGAIEIAQHTNHEYTYLFSSEAGSHIYVEGGSYTTDPLTMLSLINDTTDPSTMVITGGAWSRTPEIYIPDSYETQYYDSAFHVVPVTNAVVSITDADKNVRRFSSIDSLNNLINVMNSNIDQLSSSYTIKLLADVSTSCGIAFPSSADHPVAYTLDLDGHTYTFNNYQTNYFLYIYAGADVDITTGGHFIFNDFSSGKLAYIRESASLTIPGGTYIGSYSSTLFQVFTGATYEITGGTFSVDPTAYLDTKAYQAIDNGDGTWTVTPAVTYAASVTIDGVTTYYETLDAAISAAVGTSSAPVTESTIKLLDDINLTARMSIRIGSGTSDSTTREVTFDANGHTITTTAANGFEIVNKNTTLIITGNGTWNAPQNSGYYFYANSDGKVQVESGTFTGGNTFKSGNGTVTVYGGTYSVNPTSYAATTSTVTDNGDGTWTVTPNYAASVTIGGVTTYYLDLAEAFEDAAASTSETTVTLLSNVTVTSAITFINAANLTLDLNGHCITASTQLFKQCNGSKNFIIDDSSYEGLGSIMCTASSVSNGFIYNNSQSKLIIKSGSFSSNQTNGYFINQSGYKAGTIEIDGGYFSSEGASLRANTGSLAISDGTFNCPVVVSSDSTGNATVTGGRFNNTFTVANASNATVTGGAFTYDPTVYLDTALYAADYDEDDEYYYIIENPDLPTIATVDGYEVKTVATLNAAITDKSQIVLTGETLDGAIVINGCDEVEIDLNGNTVYAPEDAKFLIVTDSDDVVLEGGTLKPTHQESTAGGLITLTRSDFTMWNMTVDGEDYCGDGASVCAKNGGVIYATASDMYISSSTIANIVSGDTTKNTGNSGAIHMVRSAGVGSTLCLYNSTIDNCQAQGHGGALSVGSQCVAEIEESTIKNCQAPKGAAIYVDIADDSQIPAQSDFACGEVYFWEYDVTGCASTDTASSAPIYSNGFVYIIDYTKDDRADELVTTGDVYQLQTIAKVAGTSVILAEDLNIKYNIHLAQATDGDESKITLGFSDITPSNVYTQESEITGTGGYDLIAYGINATQMANDIDITVKVGDDTLRAAANEFNYSILEYAEAAYANNSKDAALAKLLANCLSYGIQAQKYWPAGGGALFDMPEALASYKTSDKATASDNARAVTVAAVNANMLKIKSALLNINEKVSLVVKVFSAVANADEGTRYSFKLLGLGDEAITQDDCVYEGNGIYRYELALTPTQYDDTFTVTLKAGNTVYHEITYSANSYVYAYQNNVTSFGSTTISAMTTAIYNYGVAAEEYVDSLG